MCGTCTVQVNRGAAHLSPISEVENVLEQPATMTNAGVPREQLLAVGVTDGLLRLSVGLEAPYDLKSDLAGAIEAGSGER